MKLVSFCLASALLAAPIGPAFAADSVQICAKWKVPVADLFNDATLDTRVTSQRVAYTFNDLINGFPGTGGTGTHPNLAGISTFYVPVLTTALTRPRIPAVQSPLPQQEEQ